MRNYVKTIGYAVAIIGTLFLAGCGDTGKAPARAVEQQAAASNQSNLLTRYPVPRLSNSLERANLIERAEFLNNQNFQSCVYLYADNGSLVAFYPVKRKVSSLNSYLLSGDQIVDDPFGPYAAGGMVVEQPDIDGAYGKNSDGIFFFTLDTNEYVEWKGDYLYTSGCSKATSSTLLIKPAE